MTSSGSSTTVKDAVSVVKSWFHRRKERSLFVVDSADSIDYAEDASYFSIRTVSGQDTAEIATVLVSFSKKEFRTSSSANKLDVNIASTADAWLGDLANEILQKSGSCRYRGLDRAVQQPHSDRRNLLWTLSLPIHLPLLQRPT